jgi:hypothetical protein
VAAETAWKNAREGNSMKHVAALGLALIALASVSFAQESGLRELTDEEIAAKMKALEPRPGDFVFKPPAGWSPNFSATAAVVGVIPEGSGVAARATVDGDGYSTWVAPLGQQAPELTLDLGRSVVFDRIVVFVRQTDARGSAGGNNALRTLAIASAPGSQGPFRELGQYAVTGPTSMCLKRVGGGQMCFFIDRAEPTVLELPETHARFVRLRLMDAHWGEYARPEWKTTVAVSEFMVFRASGPGR